MSESENLRSLLGEAIPVDGSAEDTLFTDASILDLVAQGGGNPNKSAYLGWSIKLAHYANLVDTTEGSSSRKLGQLYANAKDMVKHFADLGGVEPVVSTVGRTRIGKIVRP